MPRPRHYRQVGCMPLSNYFKPRGIPLAALEEVVLTVDEFEALRLADLQGLYQEKAAEKMNVSRQTFGRILESAHKKVAEALTGGKALRIEGGPVQMTATIKFACYKCRHSWQVPYGMPPLSCCPKCKSTNTYPTQQGPAFPPGPRGPGRGRRWRGGRGRI